LSAVGLPQTDSTRPTYAVDAGADYKFCARGSSQKRNRCFISSTV